MRLKDKAEIRDVETNLHRLLYCINRLYHNDLLTSEQHREAYRKLRVKQFEEDREIYE